MQNYVVRTLHDSKLYNQWLQYFMIIVSGSKERACQILQKSARVLGFKEISNQNILYRPKCRKDIDKNPFFSELMNWSNFISRTYFCVKSRVCVMNLISGGASAMKKAGKSGHAQLQPVMSNSRWICRKDKNDIRFWNHG